MSTPSYSPSESPFLQQVRRTLRLKHLSRRTEKSYLYLYFGLHYDKASSDKVSSS
jgi:hypothetical protein